MPGLDASMALAALLIVKHLIADGPLQTTYQVVNKGTFLHPGGLAHSGVHAGFTALVLAVWVPAAGRGDLAVVDVATLIILICALEFVVHYTIDLTKSRIDAKYAWSARIEIEGGETVLAVRSVNYFYAFLADQALHQLTYVVMILVAARLFL